MKSLFLLLTFVYLTQINIFVQKECAYFLVGSVSKNMDAAIQSSKDALSLSGFKIIGEYNPSNSENLAVVCCTTPALEEIALGFEDRGALAATLKVGFKKEGENINVSMINPMYRFYAYFIDGVDKEEEASLKISDAVKSAMRNVGSDFIPFGGLLEKEKLQKYLYKVMMPYFKNAEKLYEFNSFEEGLRIIQANQKKGKGETEQVYELVYSDKKVAVFGIGLKNAETGEAEFLPIVGDDHLAAMPYEIILQGKTATILPGKYKLNCTGQN